MTARAPFAARVAPGLSALLVGAAAGLFAGLGLTAGAVETEHGSDLMPPLSDWPAIRFVVLASWIAAWVVAWNTRGVRFFLSLGWILGVPVFLTVSLVYTWHTWGTFGYSPLP